MRLSTSSLDAYKSKVMVLLSIFDFDLINENKLLKEENLILKKNELENYGNNTVSKSESHFPSTISANVIRNTINKKRNFILIDKKGLELLNEGLAVK